MHPESLQVIPGLGLFLTDCGCFQETFGLLPDGRKHMERDESDTEEEHAEKKVRETEHQSRRMLSHITKCMPRSVCRCCCFYTELLPELQTHHDDRLVCSAAFVFFVACVRPTHPQPCALLSGIWHEILLTHACRLATGEGGRGGGVDGG